MKKLYVGNLPFQATEQDLSSWFEQAGAAGVQVTLVRDQFSGQPRGFGFVEVPSDEEAGRAVESLNGQSFMGRSIVVNEARPKATGGGGGRSYSGGGDGRGGGRTGAGGRGGRDRRY